MCGYIAIYATNVLSAARTILELTICDGNLTHQELFSYVLIRLLQDMFGHSTRMKIFRTPHSRQLSRKAQEK